MFQQTIYGKGLNLITGAMLVGVRDSPALPRNVCGRSTPCWNFNTPGGGDWGGVVASDRQITILTDRPLTITNRELLRLNISEGNGGTSWKYKASDIQPTHSPTAR